MKAQIATILLAAVLATGCAAPTAHTHSAAAPPAVNEHMQKMQTQMHQIHASQDPAERKRIMGEHMKSMQGMMPMMSGMGPRAGGDPAQRIQMMEMRMDMMHKMMEQMLQHDATSHR